MTRYVRTPSRPGTSRPSMPRGRFSSTASTSFATTAGACDRSWLESSAETRQRVRRRRRRASACSTRAIHARGLAKRASVAAVRSSWISSRARSSADAASSGIARSNARNCASRCPSARGWCVASMYWQRLLDQEQRLAGFDERRHRVDLLDRPATASRGPAGSFAAGARRYAGSTHRPCCRRGPPAAAPTRPRARASRAPRAGSGTAACGRAAARPAARRAVGPERRPGRSPAPGAGSSGSRVARPACGPAPPPGTRAPRRPSAR